MITQDAFTTGRSLIATILNKMTQLHKARRGFMIDILMLYLSLRGRRNFLQMSREGSKVEQSYRYQFEQSFDWLDFNVKWVKDQCSNECIIGFDPSYIQKSGKCSPGLGYFYSGCAGQYKRGLEIGSIAAIDVKQHTAYHLEAVQSPSARKDCIDTDKTLVDHYADIIVERSKELKQISTVLVCDAYFTKKKFIDKVCDQSGMEMIGRLRGDANLRYLYNGPKKKGPGRPRKYAGKVDVKKIDKRKFKLVRNDNECRIYWAEVYSVGLGRQISLAYVEHLDGNKVITKLYFSTNENRSAEQILNYYRVRYQMEYIFRDARQHTGLEHCQARSENKLQFHFNASMTAVSIAKGIARKGCSIDAPISISVSDVKMELQNRNMIQRIFSIYGFDHKLIKINKRYKQLLSFGKIAA